MMTPQEIALHIARKAQTKRLALNLSQKTLSERSGVSFGVIKKFERTGKISFESLLKIAHVLSALDDFWEAFKPLAPAQARSIEELLKDTTRKRGRQ
jgi:transcriptional regulator with XRE-family HTH domain